MPVKLQREWETEPNDSRAQAQNLDTAAWSLTPNDFVEQSTIIPHISIPGTGDGTFDYYSFTATPNSRAIFDIDNNNFNTRLYLYRPNGSLLASNTVGSGGITDAAQGTTSASFIDTIIANAGVYVIAVGRSNSTNNNGQIEGNAPLAGHAYTLHVSIENHPLTLSTEYRFSAQHIYANPGNYTRR